VLIPARNEEKNIGNLLTDLQKQDYHNIEIIVFNDESTDGTEKIVNNYAVGDKRIKLLSSGGLPDGWLGKNHACHMLAQKASGSWLLFLDADVRTSGSIISQTVAFADKKQVKLLSIFPRQIMKTWSEHLTVPNMNFILLSLLPLVLVRKTRFASLSAANGQFMLFNATTYRKNQPHKKMKTSMVEDIEIARFFKQKKHKVACLTGNESISCRMYRGFREAVNGFSKNVIMFFGHSSVLAVLFWLVTTFGFIVVYFSFCTFLFLAYLFTLILIRIFISVVSRQNVLKNILLLIPQQITLGLFIYNAIINRLKKQYQWKGRNIS
jgi:glycosyltransferase involved in cell wall biosynthesis